MGRRQIRQRLAPIPRSPVIKVGYLDACSDSLVLSVNNRWSILGTIQSKGFTQNHAVVWYIFRLLMLIAPVGFLQSGGLCGGRVYRGYTGHKPSGSLLTTVLNGERVGKYNYLVFNFNFWIWQETSIRATQNILLVINSKERNALFVWIKTGYLKDCVVYAPFPTPTKRKTTKKMLTISCMTKLFVGQKGMAEDTTSAR